MLHVYLASMQIAYHCLGEGEGGDQTLNFDPQGKLSNYWYVYARLQFSH